MILLPLAIAFFLTGAAIAQKAERIGPLTGPTVSEPLRNALEPTGYRIVLGDGSTLCEVWFRIGVPTQSKSDVAGVAFTELPESTLLSVVSFPQGTRDYRGQSVKAGFYAMRYALHPADGNHLGIAPTRDFLLLIPVAVDRDVGAQFKFDELIQMSRQASGTNHPAPLSLIVPENPADFPAVVEKDNGHVVLAVRLKTQAGSEIPMGLIVRGMAEQ